MEAYERLQAEMEGGLTEDELEERERAFDDDFRDYEEWEDEDEEEDYRVPRSDSEDYDDPRYY